MNPDLMQSIMQLLGGQDQSNYQIGFGAGGTPEVDPNQGLLEQLNFGQSAPQQTDFSMQNPGMFGNPMQRNQFGFSQINNPRMNMQQPARSSMNHNPSGQGASSFMSLPSHESLLNALNNPNMA